MITYWSFLSGTSYLCLLPTRLEPMSHKQRRGSAFASASLLASSTCDGGYRRHGPTMKGILVCKQQVQRDRNRPSDQRGSPIAGSRPREGEHKTFSRLEKVRATNGPDRRPRSRPSSRSPVAASARRRWDRPRQRPRRCAAGRGRAAPYRSADNLGGQNNSACATLRPAQRSPCYVVQDNRVRHQGYLT